MKNKKLLILTFLIFLSSFNYLFSQDINIKAEKIRIDEKKGITIFEKNIEADDGRGNFIYADYAEYNKKAQILKTKKNIKVTTSQGYSVTSSEVEFNNKTGEIVSNKPSEIKDLDGNFIGVEMFNYSRETNIFSSIGKIYIKDKQENEYNFSQIFIDEKKQKIVGSDLKAFFNPKALDTSNDNSPRIFSNTLSVSNEKSMMGKGVFTYCKLDDEDKCPAWSIRANKIEHIKSKKTIYYENAVLKIFDFPVFYFPKFFHPDPTVKRQSGFLNPLIIDSTNLGSGIVVPYFFNIGPDKDFTFTPKLYVEEHPLIQAEYRQDFKNSFLILDSSYTEGYKKSDAKKEPGSKNHFFLKFTKDIFKSEDKNSNIELNLQKVSNGTFLKVYDINSELIDSDMNTLESSLKYYYEDEKSTIGFTAGRFENLSITDNSRFEYLFPALTFSKNLISSEDYGNTNFVSNVEFKNYEVDKRTDLIVNDVNYESLKWLNKAGFTSQIKSTIKNVNYQAKNAVGYNNDNFRSELHGAIGYFGEVPLFKNKNNFLEFLTPKFLLRYAPGEMRDVDKNVRLNPTNIFSLDRTNELDIVETGLSAALGFEYEKNFKQGQNNNNKTLSVSMGQVINESEDLNRPAPLNQRFSDLVGEILWNPNNNTKLTYNFNIDQNYENFNYNEISANYIYGPTNFNVSFLEEREHVGKQRYVKSDFTYNINKNNNFSFSTKRDLLLNSAEYYNLSYQYSIDCFKAGVVFRREFYTDRDIEPDESLMFNISIVPFTSINSPKIN